LFALATAFGAAGSVAFLERFPPIAWPWPMGLGVAAAVLTFIGWWRKSPVPWWSAIAIIAAGASLFAGIKAYSDFDDAASQVERGLNELPVFP
jgi:hypothetical protein